jgi:hypothetical protein
MRFGTALGIMIALTAMAPAARAGSYVISVGGHRFQVEAPRTCRSASCVSVSTQRSIRPADEVSKAPAPLPPASTSAPVCATTPAQPSPANVAVAPPVLAAAASQPIAAPPAPPPAPLPPALPRFDPPRAEAPATTPAVDIKPLATNGPHRDDDAALPIGDWESVGATGTVRIERCGPALCGYTLTETSRRGESVLVNMTPKSAGVWTGNVYSRSSGNTYYGTMTLKPSGRLHVEACALGRFVCSGNDWRRVDEPDRVITTSRQWSARS